MAKLKASIVFAIVGVVLLIASYTQSYYMLEQQVLGSEATAKFYWEKYVTKYQGTSTDYDYDKAPKYPKIKETFASVLTFLTIGFAVLIASAVFNVLRVFVKLGKGSKIMKFIGVIIAVAAVVLLGISFTTFLNITKAFKDDDWPSCYSGTSQKYNCQSLYGSSDLTTGEYKWHPDVGWYLSIAGFVCAGISMGCVGASHRK